MSPARCVPFSSGSARPTCPRTPNSFVACDDEQADDDEQAGPMSTGAESGAGPDGAAPSTVTALRRPPVRQSVVVRSDRGHTFDTFVRTIGVWWPVTPFSAGKDRVR